LASAVFLRGAPGEKHLSVYSVAANYSLPLVEHEGQDYVGLLELLEPLGTVSARMDGTRWRLRYNNVEGIFQTGTNRAQVVGRGADLGGAFLMENNRGLVPLGSLASLLPRFLGGPATLHGDSDRLFIGSVATHFTASLASDNPPRLVLHFTAPVNPSVATEPGAVRLTFAHEPVVSPASATLTFGSKNIPSANYSERNERPCWWSTPPFRSWRHFRRTLERLPSLRRSRWLKLWRRQRRRRFQLRPHPPNRGPHLRRLRLRPLPFPRRGDILPSWTPVTVATITARP